MWLLRLPGTYRPQADTRLVASAFVDQGPYRAGQVLDVGTGTGAVALAATTAGSRACSVTAIDVSRKAVWTTRLNSAWRRGRLSVLRGDLLEPVAGQTFDVVLANPPYVPSPEENAPTHGRARAWDAGTDGRLVPGPAVHPGPTAPQSRRDTPGRAFRAVRRGNDPRPPGAPRPARRRRNAHRAISTVNRTQVTADRPGPRILPASHPHSG
ncbi:methyltransferase (plasmid) [Embleya sp. NBC_00888]|uniref:methyltransferase n=1 Tax=Embleya sp. NBC_00888 TaxID=2975960 RepID=UPI002F90A6DA|nr:methyltransferase [Embleya sp. NBC_00888]